MRENEESSGHSISILSPQLVDGGGALLQPERRLMLAVLEAAASDFQKYVTASTARGRRLFADAEGWFRSSATDQPLDFENICLALTLDPSFIRTGLHRWRTMRLREPPASRSMIHFPFRRVTGGRHTISAPSRCDRDEVPPGARTSNGHRLPDANAARMATRNAPPPGRDRDRHREASPTLSARYPGPLAPRRASLT